MCFFLFISSSNIITTFFIIRLFAKLRALRTLVPYVPRALRALVPHVPYALRALVP